MIIHFRACYGIEARTLPLLGEFSNLHANVRSSSNSGRTPESLDRRKVCNSITSLVSNDNWEDEMYRRKRSRTSQGSTYDDAYRQLEERKTAPPQMAVPTASAINSQLMVGSSHLPVNNYSFGELKQINQK